MEKITSKLTRVLVIVLLYGAAVTTASSQESPKVDVSGLAARGEVLANEDPLALELRNQQPEGLVRQGFDIGMGAAEGHKLPGPGKDRIRNSLTQAGQLGFTTAVSFSLERNRNDHLAHTGATIAKADSVVAEARNTTTDVFYRLGFDIATGIFGDPTLGFQVNTRRCIFNGESFFCAQGNTVFGPNSLRIRDSLGAEGRRGFNASVTFHLSRNYKPKP